MKNQGKRESPCEDTSVLAAEGEDDAKKRRKGIVGVVWGSGFWVERQSVIFSFGCC